MDKNPSGNVNARGTSSIFGPGRYHMLCGSSAQAPQLLSPCLEPVLHTGEATAMRSRETAVKGSPLMTTKESLSKATKTQHSQKKKWKEKFF